MDFIARQYQQEAYNRHFFWGLYHHVGDAFVRLQLGAKEAIRTYLML